MQRHFQVSPPSVHQMVLTLERAGLIKRTPGVARSIELLVEPKTSQSSVKLAAAKSPRAASLQFPLQSPRIVHM